MFALVLDFGPALVRPLHIKVSCNLKFHSVNALTKKELIPFKKEN